MPERAQHRAQTRDYPNVFGRVFNTPLAMHSDKAAAFVAALGSRLGVDSAAIAQATAAADGVGNVLPERLARVPGQIESNKPYVMTRGGVAVIPVLGTLVHRAAAANPSSMLWSYGEIEEMFSEAMADPMVKGIIFDINSGGGEVSGVFDLARKIRAQRGTKPIWAAADEHAYSAAYAIASAADRITVAETGGVGSVGVIAMHLDVSLAEKAAGLVYTTVYAGARKNDLSPHNPLSSDARARLEAAVADTYNLFVTMAAEHRGVSPEVMRATEADTFSGINGQAVTAKLADAVMPFADALAELTQKISQPSSLFYPGAGSAASQRPKEIAMPTTATLAADTHAATQPLEASTAPATPAPALVPVAPSNLGGEAQAQAAATPGAKIDADALKAKGVAEGLAAATEIAQLCSLAGMPGATADFLAKGMNVDQVKDDLTRRKAAADAVQTISAAHTGAQPAQAEIERPADIYARRAAAMKS